MKLHDTMSMILVAAIHTAAAGLSVGDAVVDADVKMKDVGGAMVSINDVKGEKGTLVIFTCNHCPVVKAWQDEMVAIANSCKGRGLGVIFINSNDPEAKGDTFEGMQELAKTKGYLFPYVVDATSGVAKNFGAEKTPDVFLFDAEGMLVYQGAVGEGGRAPAAGGATWLKDALDALATGEKIEVSQTKAIGCSIKWR